jgi:hypothetical protein
MVKAALVERDIEDGRQLINELNNIDSRFRVQAAFWLYRQESMEWRLIIATPLVDQRGPFSTYTDVQGILRRMTPASPLSMQDISVVSPNDKLVKIMKKAVRIPHGAPGVRFGRTMIDDTYIEDAYVYPVINRAA